MSNSTNTKVVNSPEVKSFYIETYGCQMNEYDSLIAQNILEKQEIRHSKTPEDADIILINTCAVRENAHQKIYNRVRSLQHLHKQGKKIGILGCMAQNLKEDLLYENLPIDFIAGPDAFRNLSEYVNGKNSLESQAYLKLSKSEIYDDFVPTVEHHLSSSNNNVTAFISIQRGCDNFCTFCVVPYTRGRERSRPVESIIEEVNLLVSGGFQSVVLLGQNVNSYTNSNNDFTTLIKEILAQTKIERIFFTSPHPKDFPVELIELMANEPRFCPQVHLPLQAGSNEVLKRMKRNYTKETFLNLVKLFRDKIPNIALTTDVIVGFPGETQQDFEQTREVMQLADFDSAFMFAYSERRGTLAKKLYPDEITEDVKKKRLTLIIEEQLERSLKRNQTLVGKEFEVLVEGISRRNEDEPIARLSNGKKVIVHNLEGISAKESIGKYFQVKICDCSSSSLHGDFLNLVSNK